MTMCIVDIIAIISIIFSVYFCLFYYKKYLIIKHDLKTKYMKVDARVRDAFYEAYVYARKNHNDFEAKTFNNLFLESQEKH